MQPIDSSELVPRSKSIISSQEIYDLYSPGSASQEIYMTQPNRDEHKNRKHLTLPEIKAIQELDSLHDYDTTYILAKRLFDDNELIVMPSPDLKPLDCIQRLSIVE